MEFQNQKTLLAILICITVGFSTSAQQRVSLSDQEYMFEGNNSSVEHAIEIAPLSFIYGKIGGYYEIGLTDFFALETGVGGYLPNNDNSIPFGDFLGDEDELSYISGGLFFSLEPKYIANQDFIGRYWGYSMFYEYNQYFGENKDYDNTQKLTANIFQQIQLADSFYIEYSLGAGMKFNKIHTDVHSSSSPTSFDGIIRGKLTIGYIL